MGSVSNYVVHHATCSVLVVQGEQAALGENAKILVALDRSEQSEAVFMQALAIARQNQARLMLFHCLPVEERLDYFGEIYSEEFIQNSQALKARIADQRDIDQEWLTQYSQRAADVGVAAEWDLKIGGAGYTIREYARHWEASLVVIGRRGHSGLKELILGSASNHVLHHAPCSVLIAQAAAPASV
ncbi:MAG: universal stress protein [Spirulinaceae cyanobacterium RM2_2_10]|nr:universal stress protein [Spirulinaceae cyanobacterium SM2_1_0]NJO19490.1 universal stress protein [Spirulinaceae cyanobacterium RM2_2_10]